MRHGPLLLVLLLAACGHTQSVVSGLQPGVDLAEAALRGGSPQTALQLASNVLARDPGNEAALVVQGDALTDLGSLNEARDSYSRALQSNHDSVGAEMGLGRLHLTDDPQAASVLFLHALDHDPRNTKALNDLGVARDLMGDHAGAQQAYRRALGIDPEDSAAQVNLALSMAMSGAAADAVRMLRPIASNPGASRKLQHDLAAALAMAGDRDEAARILSKDLSPGDVEQALNAYAAARSGGAPAAFVAPAGNAAAAPPPMAAAPSARSPAAAPGSAPAPIPLVTGASAPASAPPPAVAPLSSSAIQRASVPASAALPAPATGPAAAPTPQASAPPASLSSPAPPPASAQTGWVHVQLAILPSQDDAWSEWRREQRKMPALLSDRQPVVTEAERDGHPVWAIGTDGFADVAQASAFCDQVRAAGGSCSAEHP